MTKKLLITARDAAAGLHLVQVALACRQDARYEVVIAAQQPAARHFVAAGLPVLIVPPLSASSADSPQAAELRSVARQLLAEHQPDVVLAGLSTPFDAGLDEAMLAEATVPRILFQDFWGEQNLLLGAAADMILAVDDEAADLNAKRFGARSVVVGSARHAAYADLDIGAIRRDVRAGWGIGGDVKVVGFFGQALHRLPGYRRTVEVFIDALASMAEPFHLIVRPHPREDAEQRAQTEQLFRQAGIQPIVDAGGSVENALIACDVVCSLFSTCTYDTAYLNRYSPVPVAVPISMLFDEEIASYCRQHVNFETFPYHRAGVVLSVHEPGALVRTLDQAMTRGHLERIWRNAHDYLPDPGRAPRVALDAIDEFLRAWPGGRQ
jgi:hypothetical protein